MTYDNEGKEVLSPAARLDAEYLAKVAADLAACEPLEALRRTPPPPAPRYVTQHELDRVLAKMGQMIGAALKPLRERIAELEQREWLGTWTPARATQKTRS